MNIRFLGALGLVMVVLALPRNSIAEHQHSSVSHDSAITISTTASAVPGQFIVQFRPTASRNQRQSTLAALGAYVVRRIEPLNLDVLEIPALTKTSTSTAMDRILAHARDNHDIVFLEPNYIYTTTYLPNDSAYQNQWAWSMVRAPQAWDITRGSPNSTIAVLDTGIDQEHPDLKAKVANHGIDLVTAEGIAHDENGHGTHVAGTAAAATNNALGGAGMCPLCQVLPVRVLNAFGSGTLDAVTEGIIYAADVSVQVINLSLGGPGSFALQQAVDYAWTHGSFLACAAGNNGTASLDMAYPAAYGNCFAVAATTSMDQTADFSNYGSWVEMGHQELTSTLVGYMVVIIPSVARRWQRPMSLEWRGCWLHSV